MLKVFAENVLNSEPANENKVARFKFEFLETVKIFPHF